jgi:hypothetical protein
MKLDKKLIVMTNNIIQALDSVAVGNTANISVWVRVVAGILSLECCVMHHIGGRFLDVMV